MVSSAKKVEFRAVRIRSRWQKRWWNEWLVHEQCTKAQLQSVSGSVWLSLMILSVNSTGKVPIGMVSCGKRSET